MSDDEKEKISIFVEKNFQREFSKHKDKFNDFYTEWSGFLMAQTQSMGKVEKIYDFASDNATLQRQLVHAVSKAEDHISQMAEAFLKSEKRQEKLEERYEHANDIAAGKAQIPLKSHYITLLVYSVPYIVILICVLYYTKTDIKAGIDSIQISQQKLEKGQEDIKDEQQNVKHDLEKTKQEVVDKVIKKVETIK